MGDWAAIPMIRKRYAGAFGAALEPGFGCYVQRGSSPAAGAALGYARAGAAPLFLERYLDRPIEALAAVALGREVARTAIVEIGNLAAGNALAMIELWGAAANDLAASCEIGAATLTAPLRGYFARLGIPVYELAPASRECAGAGVADWGNYYELDPKVCIGEIAVGQLAMATLLARRQGAGRRRA